MSKGLRGPLWTVLCPILWPAVEEAPYPFRGAPVLVQVTIPPVGGAAPRAGPASPEAEEAF